MLAGTVLAWKTFPTTVPSMELWLSPSLTPYLTSLAAENLDQKRARERAVGRTSPEGETRPTARVRPARGVRPRAFLDVEVQLEDVSELR